MVRNHDTVMFSVIRTTFGGRRVMTDGLVIDKLFIYTFENP